jgi:D-aspartate ligase
MRHAPLPAPPTRRPSAGLAPVAPAVVLAGTAYSALAIARSLGRCGVAVHGVHADPRAPEARSRYWRAVHAWDFAAAPPATSVGWLVGLGRSLGAQRPVLFATNDAGSLLLSEHAPALREAFRLPAQPPGLARRLASKADLSQLCRAHAVPTPTTLCPRSYADVVRYAQRAHFPVLLKGSDTLALKRRVGERMRRVDDAASLLALYRAWATPGAPALVLQEYVPGPDDACWVYGGCFDAASRCVFAGTGRKLREYPPGGGVTSLAVREHNPAVEALAAHFMQALGYQGLVDMDFKRDARTGGYVLLDVNPRVGANFRLYVDRGGADAVQALYRELTDQPQPRPQPTPGRRWLVEDLDCISSLRLWRDGRLGAVAWLRSLRGLQELAWLATDDPLPALTRAGRTLTLGLRRRLAPATAAHSTRHRAALDQAIG